MSFAFLATLADAELPASVPTGAPPAMSAQGYVVPGRSPGSEKPWELFLGSAAHRLISYIYGVNHPGSVVFYNTKTIAVILSATRTGDPSRLLPSEVDLCPDIVDGRDRVVFEVKPLNERGLLEGRAKVYGYLAALNRAAHPGLGFSPGTDFHGEILIRFAQGEYIWRLTWRTTEPGLVQYRWTRSQQRFESEAAAYQAGHWVELTSAEFQQYGGWVGRAVEGMVARRERLENLQGVIGMAVDIVGNVAVSVLSANILDRLGAGARSSPAQALPKDGAKVIPFPSRASPPSTPATLPAASGR